MAIATRELTDELARIWGAAPQQAIAETSAAAYDHLLARLPVEQPGEEWVDIATGTGPLGIRAARAGASVNAIDIAPELLDIGRALAAEADVSVLFDRRRAERHNYVPDTVQVVATAFGAMYALEPVKVAAQMASIVRPGGRIGLISWTPDSWVADTFRLSERFPSGNWWHGPDPFDWGTEPFATELFGDRFALDFKWGDVPLVARSGEAAWELFVANDGPTRSVFERLGNDDRAGYRAAFVDLAERHRGGDQVVLPRPCLLVTGRRR